MKKHTGTNYFPHGKCGAQRVSRQQKNGAVAYLPLVFVLAVICATAGCSSTVQDNKIPVPNPLAGTVPAPSASPFLPYPIEAGGNTPEGVIFTYFNALDRGDYSKAVESTLLFTLLPEKDKAPYLNNFTRASERTFGRKGEYIKNGNYTVVAKERLAVCNIQEQALKALCQSDITDSFRVSITMDETSEIPGAHYKNTRSFNVGAFLYKGSWKFVA